MVPFKPVPVINIPGIGELSAVAACEQMKVASQNDKVQLQKAKNMTYLKGFYDGVTITHVVRTSAVLVIHCLCPDNGCGRICWH